MLGTPGEFRLLHEHLGGGLVVALGHRDHPLLDVRVWGVSRTYLGCEGLTYGGNTGRIVLPLPHRTASPVRGGVNECAVSGLVTW